jgi:hypothetical protein
MASTIADIGTQIAEIGTQITEIGTDIANQSDEIDVLRTRLGVIESLGQVIGSVDTKADLPVNVDDAKSLFKIHGITTNDFAIVITDEDNDGASTRYEVVVDDLGVLTWVYAGAYSSAVPTAIPNPSALTIEQGTLSTIYDGSTQQTVTIPAAPTKLPSPYSVYFLTLDQSNGIPVDVPYDGSIDRFIAWRKLSFINEKGTEIASYRPTYILNHTSEDRWDPVKITLPSSATIPTALPNPNSLTLGDYTYDGSAAVSATFPPIPTRLPCQYPLSIFNVQYSETSVDILNMFYYGNTSHGISGRLLQFYDSDGNLLGQY